ncbi:MAG: hypothetical protein O9277_02865 [Magnetospirillum sp.]|nr:hypothetical protein [Magnetospirillum sp.]
MIADLSRRVRPFRILGQDVLLIAAFLAVVAILIVFFSDLGGSPAQALGNVIGGAVGAFAAFYVAYWSLTAADRERRIERSYAAAALVNAAMDRYYDIRRVVDRLSRIADPDFARNFATITPNEIHLPERAIRPELVAEFARQFIYETHELNDLDRRLRQADQCFGNAYRHHAAIQPELVPLELAKGIAYLRIAGEAWRNIVDGYAFARRAAKRDDGTSHDYERGAENLLEDIEAVARRLPSVDLT